MSLFNKLGSTSLKSLKFGQKQTAGDNTKPYIVTDINTVDRGFNRFRLTKFDDGLIRGGAVGALNAGLTDTVRISKFLVDFPKGPLFLLKQVGLQLSNPRLETKQLPTDKAGKGTFGKVVAGISNIANKLNNLVGGPSRIYNLGINTLAQVPLNAIGGHIVRHGFLPVQNEDQKYIKVVDANNKNGTNRLMGLYDTLLADTDTRVNFFKNNRYSSNLKTKIDDYLGGPKSVYGIGRTAIFRTTFTGDKSKIRESLNINASKSRKIEDDIQLYTSKDDSIFNKFNNKFEFNQDQRSSNKEKWKGEVSQSLDNSLLLSTSKTSIDKSTFTFEPTSSYHGRKSKQSSIGEPINTLLKFDPNRINDKERNLPQISPADHVLDAYKTYVPNNYGASLLFQDTIGSDLTDNNVYNKGVRPLVPTFDSTYNKLIDSKVRKANFRVPTTYDFDETAGRVNTAIINNYKYKDIDSTIVRLPIIANKNDTRQYDYNLVNSLLETYERVDNSIMMVKFYQLDPFTGGVMNSIPFSAYLSGYSETYNSGWNEIKYNGRSDYFYVFDNYKKTATFKLQIPVFNPSELKTKHYYLETLQRGLAGKYLDNRLGGVITRIRLGHYLRNAACIINSIGISIPDQASWDWGVDGNTDSAYAMLLDASFSITVISDDLPGFSDTTPAPPKEENPKKDEEVKKEKPKKEEIKAIVNDKKVAVTRGQFQAAELDNLRVENNKYYRGELLKKGEAVKKRYEFQGFGGGDFVGGGADGVFENKPKASTTTAKATSVKNTIAKNK